MQGPPSHPSPCRFDGDCHDASSRSRRRPGREKLEFHCRLGSVFAAVRAAVEFRCRPGRETLPGCTLPSLPGRRDGFASESRRRAPRRASAGSPAILPSGRHGLARPISISEGRRYGLAPYRRYGLARPEIRVGDTAWRDRRYESEIRLGATGDTSRRYGLARPEIRVGDTSRRYGLARPEIRVGDTSRRCGLARPEIRVRDTAWRDRRYESEIRLGATGDTSRSCGLARPSDMLMPPLV